MQPLAGLTVLDLSRVWIGPAVSHLLSDFGADIVEVRSRTVDPRDDRFGNFIPLAYDDSVREYTDISRNRRSVTLNLNRAEGRELLKRLVPHCDILTENFAVRVMRNLSLTYETLRPLNPRLIMISMTAAGQSGPWAHAMTYAPSLTALYGGKSLIGYADDQRPLEDASEMDPMNAIYAVIAILAALRHRERTGEGCYIDLAQGEAIFQAQADTILDYQMNGRVPAPVGNAHPVYAPHNTYRCAGANAWVAISVETRAEWAALARTIGKPAWADAPGFASVAARRAARGVIDPAITAYTQAQDPDSVAEALQGVGVAAYPVHDGLGMMADPQLAARRADLRVEAAHIDPSQIWYGVPWKLRGTPGSIKHGAPPYGAHNQAIFGEWLGLSTAQIDELAAQEIIF